MRVLLVSAAYPPDRCGVGDYAWHLAQRLAARGRVELAVLTASEGAGRENPGVPIVHAEGGAVLLPDLWRAARRIRPDIVHFQHPTMRLTHSHAGSLAKWGLGLTLVETWHEYVVDWNWCFWLRAPAIDGLLYVRPDLPSKLHPRIRLLMKRAQMQYVPNGRSIPSAVLPDSERIAARRETGGGRPIVAFFGFMFPNKNVHLLFEIADAARHHLLLIGELDERNEYQRRIGDLARRPPWRGHATVTNFVDAREAARLLAVVDAFVFPFSEGTGPWNTSVNAAIASGALVVATTAERGLTGYHADRNLFLAQVGDVAAMREGLARHLGARRAPDLSDDWDAIAEAHERFYERVR